MGNRQPLGEAETLGAGGELALGRADYLIAGEMPAQLAPTSLMVLAKHASTVRGRSSTGCGGRTRLPP